MIYDLFGTRSGGWLLDRLQLCLDFFGRTYVRKVLFEPLECGFFEWPRNSTGEEVADALGISQPAFLQHLRAAERKLVGGLCEHETASE